MSYKLTTIGGLELCPLRRSMEGLQVAMLPYVGRLVLFVREGGDQAQFGWVLEIDTEQHFHLTHHGVHVEINETSFMPGWIHPIMHAINNLNQGVPS